MKTLIMGLLLIFSSQSFAAPSGTTVVDGKHFTIYDVHESKEGIVYVSINAQVITKEEASALCAIIVGADLSVAPESDSYRLPNKQILSTFTCAYSDDFFR